MRFDSTIDFLFMSKVKPSINHLNIVVCTKIYVKKFNNEYIAL